MIRKVDIAAIGCATGWPVTLNNMVAANQNGSTGAVPLQHRGWQRHQLFRPDLTRARRIGYRSARSARESGPTNSGHEMSLCRNLMRVRVHPVFARLLCVRFREVLSTGPQSVS